MSGYTSLENIPFLEARTLPEFCQALWVDTQALETALDGVAVERSLEIGCGFGRLTPWIADRSTDHVAVDYSMQALAAASKEFQSVTVAGGTATSLPVATDAVDLVVTWGVLNHVVEDIETALAEIDRVTAPGGVVVLSEATAGRDDPRWEYRAVEEWAALLAGWSLESVVWTARDTETFRHPEREHAVMRFERIM